MSQPGERDFMHIKKKVCLVVVSFALILTFLNFAPQLDFITGIPNETVENESPLSGTPAPIPASMISYWELNENGGTDVYDRITPYVNGSTSGNPMWISGVVESGLELLPNQYIDFDYPSYLYLPNILTIEAWVNLPDTNGLHTILMNSYSSINIQYHFAIQDGSLYFDRQNGAPGNSVTSSATISTDQWYHVAVAMEWASRRVLFYIDGVEEIINQYSDAYDGPSGLVTIGADRTTGNPAYFQGLIDEVAIYDDILPASTIQEHYEKGLLGLSYIDDLPQNEPPVAVDDSYTTDEDVLLSVATPGVLANDYDPDPLDIISADLVTEPQFGSLTFFSDGNFEYTPGTDWHGIDSFTYRVFDGSAFGNLATVTITVNAVNDAPVSEDDGYTTDEDTSLTILTSDLLANDSDVDGDPLFIQIESVPSSGTFTILPGEFVYTPNPDWFGTDSFTYRVFDGSVFGNLATVIITVNPVNDAPVAGDDAFTGYEDMELVETSLLLNDYDAELQDLEVYLETGPSHGLLTLYPDGSFEYQPNPNYFGIDSFTYRAFDGLEYSNVATVTLTIIGVNDAPEAYDDFYIADEGFLLSVGIPLGVLSNDLDIDSTTLTAHLIDSPAFGMLTLNGDGSFEYFVDDWSGSVTFTYRVFDGIDYSSVATVTIDVIEDDDKTGPEITITYAGDATDGAPGTWTVTVVDPESGVDSITVEIDGILVDTIAGIYPVPNTLGTHTIIVTATNADLDTGPADQETSTLSDTVTIVDDDITGPSISITYTGAMTEDNPGFWTIIVSDLESGVHSIVVEIDGVLVGSIEGDYAVPSSVGYHSITVIALNDDLDRPSDQESNTSSDTVYIQEQTLSTEIIYTGDLSGVYSDPLHLEALLIDAASQTPILGKTILFTVGAQSALAVTNDEGIASVIIILDQEEGVYTISVSFDGDDDYPASSSTSEFTIIKECASTIYTGVTVLEVSEESITLMATVFDDADGHWGDITHIYVTFTFYLSSDPLTPVHATHPVRVQTTDVAGVGLVTLEIPNLPEGEYLVVVSLLPEHNRYYCSPDSNQVTIIIYEPEFASAKGVGTIVGADGHHGYFVFNVRYTGSISLKGFIFYIYRVDDWVYFIRSTEILGLITDENNATFEANCTINRYNFETHTKICSDEIYRARIDVFESQNRREKDVFQMRIFDGIGLVEYEAGFDPYGYLVRGHIIVNPGRRRH